MKLSGASRVETPNKSLQVTFDPPPTFAAAKAGVASNAPELRRYMVTLVENALLISIAKSRSSSVMSLGPISLSTEARQ